MTQQMRLVEIWFVLPNEQTPIIVEAENGESINYEIDEEGCILLNTRVKVKTRLNLYGYWNLREDTPKRKSQK